MATKTSNGSEPSPAHHELEGRRVVVAVARRARGSGRGSRGRPPSTRGHQPRLPMPVNVRSHHTPTCRQDANDDQARHGSGERWRGCPSAGRLRDRRAATHCGGLSDPGRHDGQQARPEGRRVDPGGGRPTSSTGVARTKTAAHQCPRSSSQATGSSRTSRSGPTGSVRRVGWRSRPPCTRARTPAAAPRRRTRAPRAPSTPTGWRAAVSRGDAQLVGHGARREVVGRGDRVADPGDERQEVRPGAEPGDERGQRARAPPGPRRPTRPPSTGGSAAPRPA